MALVFERFLAHFTWRAWVRRGGEAKFNAKIIPKKEDPDAPEQEREVVGHFPLRLLDKIRK
jgi:hypothetical protein